MAIQFLNIPRPEGSRPLDFNPLARTITDARQSADQSFARDQNRLLGGIRAEKGNRAASDEAFRQGNLEIGAAFSGAADQDDDRKRALRDAFIKKSAGVAQMALEAPEEQRAAVWTRLRGLDPDADKELAEFGIDPNDHNAGLNFIIAQARGYQDPLARQKTMAEIEKSRADAEQSRAHAQYYRAGGSRAAGGAAKGYQVTLNPETGEEEWTYIPGGPADPETIAKQAQARGNKNRTLSATDIGKLTDAGETYQNLAGFNQTFKDEYGGLGAGGYGAEALTWAARNGLPGFGGYKDQAEWWQNYDRHKNIVRNDLFGAALTPGEKAEFDKADINPNMDPEIIRRNLARQQLIKSSAIRRRMKSMIAAGYQQQPIEEAYGITLPELDAALQGWDKEQADLKEAQRKAAGNQPPLPPGTPGAPPPAMVPQVNPQMTQPPPSPSGGQRPPEIQLPNGAGTARLAPDGNYYIPDPSRHGKFIQVIP